MTKAILAFFILGFSIVFDSSASAIKPLVKAAGVINSPATLRYQIIPAANSTWGYNILKDNKIFIHQPHKPGIPGKEGFKDKRDAIKVAELVIAKLQRGEMPPTISLEEMRSLKIFP